MARLESGAPVWPVDKALNTLRAELALREGIAVEPSIDDAGRKVLILSRGPWVREVRPEQLAQVLAELKATPT